MPRIRLTTEYESKYSRRLWDEATRSNYFQLADERKSRMLRGTTHAPIHWEHDPDIEVIDITSPVPTESSDGSSPEPIESKKSPTRPLVCRNKITSKLSPEPPRRHATHRNAWCDPSTRPATRGSCTKSEEEAELKSNFAESATTNPQKRSKEQSSPTPSGDDREERKRQKSKLPTPLPQSVSPIKGHSPIYRPQSAPQSHSHTNYVHRQPKRQPPFAMYGNTAGNGTRQTYNVKPRSKEIYSSAIRAKNERERLQLYRQTSEKYRESKNAAFPTNILNNLPRDIGSWVTEYQGNFKAYTF